MTTANVVLVHAAWADASSWNKVIPLLREQGLKVVSAQIPLTSLADDAAALTRVLKKMDGPVILAGHSYGGAVITAVDQPNVKALVYIAAMAPAEGETVGELLHRAPPHPQAPALAPDQDGFLWMPPEAISNAVAHRATSSETALMAATQKPISVKCLGEPMGEPAWKAKPSWFLLAEQDRMISPSTQRFMAERMRAVVVARDLDHSPLISAPAEVASVILEAASQ
jgi:pimeloyl-ACP methyl ester carboxylesterase